MIMALLHASDRGVPAGQDSGFHCHATVLFYASEAQGHKPRNINNPRR
jgi:hypothetical protein